MQGAFCCAAVVSLVCVRIERRCPGDGRRRCGVGRHCALTTPTIISKTPSSPALLIRFFITLLTLACKASSTLNAYRFVIPLVFGVAAGVANFMALKSSSSTIELTVAAEDVEAGAPLKETQLRNVTVRVARGLVAAAVPYEQRSVALREARSAAPGCRRTGVSGRAFRKNIAKFKRACSSPAKQASH